MTKRPFAAFDIDGTVMRWQLYHALVDELVRQGHLDRTKFQKVRRARMTWKQRVNENSFRQYEMALIKLVDETLAGLALQDFEKACQNVMAEYRDQVYTYTRNLIQELKSQNYLLFAISASQVQIVSMFANYYDFDDYGGSEYEVKDGHFTGNKTLLMKNDIKPAFLRDLATKHGASYQGSLAVADSESDIPMLGVVEKPIAFNPTNALFNHALAQGWKIVIERKNVVYKLEPINGTYVLAQTS